MPAARYWRVKNIVINGGVALEISEWRLYNIAIPVDIGATITAQSAASGSIPLSRLNDGVQSQPIGWLKAVVEDPGFWIKWDLGSATEVTGTRWGAYDNSTRYPTAFSLEWSDNDTDWTTFVDVSGSVYPGTYQMSPFFPYLAPTPQFRTSLGPMPAPYAPSPSGAVFNDPAIRNHRRDFEGWGRIVGTTKEKALPSNTPLRRKVLCLDMLTSTVVGETWSDATTGNYVFNDLDLTRRYTVLAYDHTLTYRAVIADNLTPELMT